MVLTVRCLAYIAALVLGAVGQCHAHLLSGGDIYEVPEADRLSAKQRFAREADILPFGERYIDLVLSVPGRVYVRHIENATAVAAGLFGRVRASGDTHGAVEFVALPRAGEAMGGGGEDLTIGTLEGVKQSEHQSESLLVEVELYEKNVLKDLIAYGSADVVVLEDVKAWVDVTVMGTDDKTNLPGNLFVSDPRPQFYPNTLVVSSDSVVQLDLTSLNSTQTNLWVYALSSANVTLFASEFVSTVSLEVATKDGERTPRNPLCISTKNDVQVSLTINEDLDQATNTTIPGGSMCTKLPLPPRQPSRIGDGVSKPSDTDEDATVTTSSPPASVATPTTPPTASLLVWSPVLAIVLVECIGR